MFNDVRLPSSKYLSLDLFDTLLIRKYPEPVIFEKAFLSLESTLICGLDVEEFVEYRQKAVIIARQKLNKVEVSIHQIYQYLVVPEYDRENLLKAELTEHAKALVLNHDLLNELKGKFDAESFNPLQIAFISDMYLTKSQILTILSEFDSWLVQFPIFVSSEYDKTKRLGDLFPFVKDQLGWEFSSWVHVGDDRLADVIKPEEYGITTGFINYYSEYDLLLKKENEQLKMPVEYESDRKVASLKGDCNSFKLGAMVFGPILSAFADWVIDKALAVGAQQILSISREGICFDHVIRQKLQMREIDSVNSQVFYASRRSVLLASVDTERDKWLETLFIEIIDLGNISVSEFYEIIKLSLPSKLISEKHVMSQSWSKRSLDSISLQQFLLNDVRLKKQLIVQNVALAKNSFDGYLAPISGIENCITLDFGGGGTIQGKLAIMLPSIPKANLLFYKTERSDRFLDFMTFSAFISQCKGDGELVGQLVKNYFVIEALFNGWQGSVVDYQEGCGSPIFGSALDNNKLILEPFYQGIAEFIKGVSEHCAITTSSAKAIMSRFICSPLRDEVNLLKCVYHQSLAGNHTPVAVVGDNSDNSRTYLWEGAQYSVQRKAEELTHHQQALISKIQKCEIQRAAIYGAGQYFQQILSVIVNLPLEISCVIDRKAEVAELTVEGYQVYTLDHAIQTQVDCIIIASASFEDDIENHIRQRYQTQLADVEVIRV